MMMLKRFRMQDKLDRAGTRGQLSNAFVNEDDQPGVY
jgi:hypothetical protein